MNDVIDSTTPVRLRAILKGLSERTSDNWAHIHSELMVPPGTLKRTWLEKEDESGDSSLDESEYSDEQSNATAAEFALATEMGVGVCRAILGCG